MQKLIEFCQHIDVMVKSLWDSLDAVVRALRQCFVFLDDLVDVLPSIMYGVLFASFVVITCKMVVGRQ